MKIKRIKPKDNSTHRDSLEEFSDDSSYLRSSGSSVDDFSKAVKKAQTKRAKVKKIQKLKKNKPAVDKKKKSKRRDVSGDTSDTSSDSLMSSSSGDDSSDSASQSSGKDRKIRKKHKKGKQVKSGVKAKAHKIRIKTSELCAQAVLDEEHCPGSFSLEDLTFNQLVAGELEICTICDISRKERTVRLKILKLLAYYASILPQLVLIDIYKAVILKVEKGLFKWSSELVKKTENMLDRAVSKNKLQKEMDNRKIEKGATNEKTKDRNKKELGLPLKSGERIVYCADFNRSRCDKEPVHEGKFAGKEVTKHHVCKTCLTLDKEKKFHAENEDKCPHKNA